MAESLRAQGKPEAAFDAQLRAVESAPEIAHLHGPLVEMARACGQMQQLVERLLALVERRRRKADMGVASTLLLLAADVAEHDFGDQTRALDLHRRAEEMQPRSFEVLSGIARLAQQQGELRRMRSRRGAAQAVGAEEARSPKPPPRRCIAPPRSSSVAPRRATPASPTSARRSRRAAIWSARRRWSRARACPRRELVKILPLYERIARQSGDERRAARLPRAAGRHVRRHARRGRARRSIWRSRFTATIAWSRCCCGCVDIAADRADGREDATWALFELLRDQEGRRRSSTRAARILERAAELLPLERVCRSPAISPSGPARPATGAWAPSCSSGCAPRRRPTNPSGGRCWTTTSALRDRDGLARLVAETLPLLPEVAQRNQLRMALARLRLAEDAGDRLRRRRSCRTSCWRSASHGEALALLAGYYERIGSEGDLVDLLAQAFDAAIAAGDPEAVVAAAIRLGGVLERTDAERAAETYERALTVAPRRGELLRRLLALRPRGRPPASTRS